MSGTTNPGERGRFSAPRKAATISLAGTTREAGDPASRREQDGYGARAASARVGP
jgi:hypothetical protein